MALLNEFEMDERFLERVGFAVAALDYFVALEESGFDDTQHFESLWSSMVCAAIHIQRAETSELVSLGSVFVQRYFSWRTSNKKCSDGWPSVSSESLLAPAAADLVVAPGESA